MGEGETGSPAAGYRLEPGRPQFSVSFRGSLCSAAPADKPSRLRGGFWLRGLKTWRRMAAGTFLLPRAFVEQYFPVPRDYVNECGEYWHFQEKSATMPGRLLNYGDGRPTTGDSFTAPEGHTQGERYSEP